jgi:hypothetical protein
MYSHEIFRDNTTPEKPRRCHTHKKESQEIFCAVKMYSVEINGSSINLWWKKAAFSTEYAHFKAAFQGKRPTESTQIHD